MLLSERDKNTKSYELAVKFKDNIIVQFVLNVNGTKFTTEGRVGIENKATVFTCIKR
jgi:hypothetical protein